MRGLTKYDVAIVGAGIMGATLASFLRELEPAWTIAVVERQAKPAMESSGPWHNAGTGHSALCEMNYTPRGQDGTVNIEKALEVHSQWQESLQAWAHLVRSGLLSTDFIHPIPHMSFVEGEANVEYLRARFEALHAHPYFASMEYSEDPETIRAWAPLLMEGRSETQHVAVTRSLEGTDVDFGRVTEDLLASSPAAMYYDTEVHDLYRVETGGWIIQAEMEGQPIQLQAPFVFVGGGGGTLPLLQKAKIKEVRGYGGFPIAGKFWHTEDPRILQAHGVKVYSLASVGAPPMSVPHLDTRIIGGSTSILFGPFAGFSPKFLRDGSLWDLFRSLRLHNLIPMLAVALANLGLVKYLVKELASPRRKKLEGVQAFYPLAEAAQWTEIVAGQRVQIIKPKGKFGGTLQFGTEVIMSEDGSIAGLLGASPGASTAVTIVLEVLDRAFADRQVSWRDKLEAMVPTHFAPNPEATLAARQTLGL